MAGEIQIKGTRNGLVILLPTTGSFDELKQSLCQKMESAKGFFQGARFTLHQEKAPLPSHQRKELEQLLTGYGLVPAPDITLPRQPAPPVKKVQSGGRTHIIWQGLRSGQEIRHDLGHLVVMGNVHSGALVEAGGHVIIMGSCAGTVRAGIHGNRRAKVVSLAFRGAVVSIAGIHALTGEAVSVPGPGPHRAVLRDEKIVFEPFPTQKGNVPL
jgi:septum site-determining protein MinC